VFTGLNRFGPRLATGAEALFSSIWEATGVEPLNQPSRVLGRLELLKTLYQQGKNRFRARGAWEDLSDLHFPVFVRDRSQDGGVPRLLFSRREIETEIGWALVRGAEVRQLIVVEFLDTKGQDGLYRKYSAYVVGEKVIPVSLERGRDWVLRYPVAEFSPEGLEEEKAFVVEDPHGTALREVRSLAGVGFGRMDYSMLQGEPQVWEMNTLPTMRLPAGASPLPPDLKVLRQGKMSVFKTRFQEAWRDLEGEQSSLPGPLPFDLDEEVASRALEELSADVPGPFPQPDRYASMKAALRPLKSLVMPLASRTVIPFFARAKMERAVQGPKAEPGP